MEGNTININVYKFKTDKLDELVGAYIDVFDLETNLKKNCKINRLLAGNYKMYLLLSVGHAKQKAQP